MKGKKEKKLKIKPISKKALSRSREKKPINLTYEEKRKVRGYMPSGYRLMAGIIEEARNRRKESLEIIGMLQNKDKASDAEGVLAICPRCGHGFKAPSDKVKNVKPVSA